MLLQIWSLLTCRFARSQGSPAYTGLCCYNQIRSAGGKSFVKRCITRYLLPAASYACVLNPAVSLAADDRSAVLDAIRPLASRQVGHTVRFKVDRFNQDSGWAVLVGKVVGPPDRPIDWERVDGCDPVLDKMLWVVLRKTDSRWQVKHLEICASEPPYWYLEDYGGLVWPCGVYAGLLDASGSTLEQRCRSRRNADRRSN
jgi:hypothetical protein